MFSADNQQGRLGTTLSSTEGESAMGKRIQSLEEIIGKTIESVSDEKMPHGVPARELTIKFTDGSSFSFDYAPMGSTPETVPFRQ